MFATRYERAVPEAVVQDTLLTQEAIRFLGELAHAMEPARRRTPMPAIAQGVAQPTGTEVSRPTGWAVVPSPADLVDRRVEITGAGTDRRNPDFHGSRAKAIVLRLDQYSSALEAHESVGRFVTAAAPEDPNQTPPALMICPRGWTVREESIRIGGKALAAPLFDTGLFLFHHARTLIRNGTGPYFCLPDAGTGPAASLWNELFVQAQKRLGISPGTVRASVKVEAPPTVSEIDQILWELREHAAGLTCGYSLANRNTVLLTACHRRRTHAIAEIGREVSFAEARRLLLQAVWDGFDGARVEDINTAGIARQVFDTYMPLPNQFERKGVKTL
jgi:malate synthase